MSAVNAEYQHFIPQFIVKNYSFPFSCPEAEQKGKKQCKNKCKHEKGKYPGDLVVNCVDLTPPFQLGTYPVKRIFGAPNMYNDPTHAETNEQRRIEAMFSKMESQASAIFRRIVKTHEEHRATVTLTRTERDLIRKFFFLLKYRGSTFHRRFYHDDPENYFANDRELLLEYMAERGFSTPRDVWFHNLETIMNLKMDCEGKWRNQLPRNMYPEDALWFLMHADAYYMAICTPSDPMDEFLLTDNCYNVFEGPNTFIQDKVTGQVQGGSHAGFHEFAPISPSLIIVLRSNALPNPEEDWVPHIGQERRDTFWSAIGHVYGTDTKSMLDDLPIKKCEHTYSNLIDEDGHLLPLTEERYRPNDQFHFKYFPIKSRHVRIMNNIFLDNAFRTGMLAFRSEKTFFKILETYISGPCKSHKIVGGEDSESQYQFFKGLETLAQTLGSQKSLLFRRMDVPNIVSSPTFMDKQLEYRRMGMRRLMNGPEYRDSMTSFFELYCKLVPDTNSGFDRDLAQAGKMVYFQAMVETLGLGCTEAIQRRNAAIISSMFRASYCSRYWLYLKLRRKSRLGDRDGTQDLVDLMVAKEISQGPEDIFAQTAKLYDENTLNNLMHITVFNDIDNKEFHVESIWTVLANARSLFYHTLMFVVVFARPGKIRHCGIPTIERLAKQEERAVRQRGSYCDLLDLPYLDEDQNLELAVRIRIRSKFQAAMAGKAEESILRELEDIFFRLTFPTPPPNSDQPTVYL